MMKKLLALILLGTLMQAAQAADNPFEKNYKAQNTGNLQSLQSAPDTKIYVSNHKDDDNISMLENGYDMMGSSGFEATNVSPDLALQHARSIKADVVLVYSKYASKQMSLSKIQAIKEAAKTTGEIDEKDLKGDEEQQKYYASYWAKLPPPLFGVHIIKLKPVKVDPTTGEREMESADNGLKVLAVIKGSPAEKANLMRGDVLLKIGDITLQKPEELSAAARQYQGKTVDIAYERDGQAAVAKATLNSR